MIRPKQSRNSSKAWAERLFAPWVCTLSAIVILGAQSAKAADDKQSLIYDVYAGGFHAVQANLNLDFEKKGHYEAVLNAHTRGFLGALAPWTGSFESRGWLKKGPNYIPKQHKSIATWRDETEIKDYQYTVDRKFSGLTITDHDKPPYKKDVDDALTQGTTDVLSATLAVMDNVAKTGKCAHESEVFDGKRRFKMIFQNLGKSDLKSTRYNIYEGETIECSVEVKPVAGDWHKKPRGWMSIQEQGRERGTMPTIWLAKLPNTSRFVPVKVRVKTDYGTLFMHLSEYRKGKDVRIAEKRKDD